MCSRFLDAGTVALCINLYNHSLVKYFQLATHEVVLKYLIFSNKIDHKCQVIVNSISINTQVNFPRHLSV